MSKNILIVNDDGIHSEGIVRLAQAASRFGRVWVAAPDEQCSGMSQKISIFDPILVRPYDFPAPVEAAWSIGGTPADCVKVAVGYLLNGAPDLVLSGINNGYNAGFDNAYSGTIGAAMEGAVNGIPAIGVSLDTFSPDADFSCVEALLPRILDKLLENPEHRYGHFYNINFPNRPAERIHGVRVTRMGYGHWEREYQDFGQFLEERGRIPSEDDCRYIARLEPGEQLYVMAGDFTDNGGNPADADHILLQQGYVTITAANIDNTDLAELDRLCAII